MGTSQTKFLDPDRPIATCVSKSCDTCPLQRVLHCHFTLKDLMYFLLMVSPSFLLGGKGICQVNGWMLIPWLAIIIGYFGFVEIRVLCSHCPHYAEEGTTLTCWANYGSPKIWKYRPGPMTFMEKVIFFLGLACVWGYPLIFLIVGFQYLLLALYLLTSAGFFATLKKFLCPQCMNFACPLNAVAHEVRTEFFNNNPEISRAWTER